MKKLFLFAAALLMSAGMMAADYIPAPANVYTIGDEETLGTKWADKGQPQNFIVKGDTVIFNAFLCYQSNGDSPKQSWTGQAGGGSTGATFEATGCFPANTAWGSGDAGSKCATTRSTRTYYYNVTNCGAVLVLINLNGSNREAYVKAYEIVNGTVSSDVAASETRTENGLGIIELAGLNINKTYRITVNTNTDSNSNFFGIAFVGSATNVVTKYTVTYMDGETVLGTESVKEGEQATKASTFEAKNHATFDGWFEDDDFMQDADFTAAINADKTFYGKWTAEQFTASSSINIEQGVLDYTKAWDIKGALADAHIAYANINELDSLNDAPNKTNRNEPFLGLKLKTAGAYVEVGLNAGDVLKVKFGNVADDVKIDGVTVAKDDINNVVRGYEYTATAEGYVRIETTTGGTVVLKQIMINEAIKAVELPEPVATALENIQAVKAEKMIENGRVVIRRDGKRFNLIGAEM